MKKNTMKKLLALACAGAMSVSLAACGNGNTDGGSSGEAGGDTVKIGILQYAQHPSLDNCHEGVIQGLAEAGYVEGETSPSNSRTPTATRPTPT